jgi:hypothetical protein
VRNWFTAPVEKSRLSYQRSYSFLTALSIVTLQYLKEFCAEGAGNLASTFRGMMRGGQKFSRPGPERVRFYEKVIERAEKVG